VNLSVDTLKGRGVTCSLNSVDWCIRPHSDSEKDEEAHWHRICSRRKSRSTS
jgi:hypothetical protein